MQPCFFPAARNQGHAVRLLLSLPLFFSLILRVRTPFGWLRYYWLHVPAFCLARTTVLRPHRTNPLAPCADKLFFFFRGMTAFFRGPTTIFRRLENSNSFQRNDNVFQMLIMDCSGAIHLILGTFLLPIFRYPLPRPKMDFLIQAARSRSSRGPAKYAQIFRTNTTIFRT